MDVRYYAAKLWRIIGEVWEIMGDLCKTMGTDGGSIGDYGELLEL